MTENPNNRIRDGAASILAVLVSFPPEQRLDVLATACAAYCQSNGQLQTAEPRRPSKESLRNSHEAKMGPGMRNHRKREPSEKFREMKKREPRCECFWEEGDSPCPVHGNDEAAAPAREPKGGV